MEKTNEQFCLTLLNNRENLYRLLARIYFEEADEAFLNRLRGMGFPSRCGDAEMEEGFRLMEEYLKNVKSASGDAVTDLAVDYARVFLGAGIAVLDAAYPYESVYTSGKRIIMQKARDEVVGLYLEKGLKKSESLDFPEDHVALELEFMAFLCAEAKRHVEAGDYPAAAACCGEQKVFLGRHLLNWVPGFCADVLKYSATEFYRAAAKITAGFLRMDNVMLESLIAGIEQNEQN